MFERIIGAISPEWAARRLYFRTVLDQARAYDAAKTGRRTAGWSTQNGSANAEIGTGASRIRARTRDLVRNNPYAASAVTKLAAKTVGVGIIPRLRAGAAEIERKRFFADRWEEFSDHCDPEGRSDFYGLQHLLARTVFESGEALVRLLPRRSSFGLRVPLQVQILEPDYLDSSRNQSIATGVIIQGVEYDLDGRRVAYWMFDEHPGETVFSFIRAGLQSRRIPADQVLHVFDPLRPGQARGVSTFTPVVLKLRDVDDYDDAELMRKKIGACFAAFVRQQTGGTGTPLTEGTIDAKGRRLETLQPGTVQYLGLDQEVTFATPPAVDGYVEFMTHQLHAIAAGIGTTYEQLTGDLSRVNYSSARVGLLDFWDLLDHWQWHVMIPQFCRPVWSRVAALLVATGQIDASDGRGATWSPPVRRYVDPDKEVTGQIKAIRAGLVTLPQGIADRGEDPDVQLSEIAETNAQLDRAGIILDTDPRRVSYQGQSQQTQSAKGAGEQEESSNA
jgi:lambda family phage portal protein